MNEDLAEIDALTAAFFRLFSREAGERVKLSSIHDLFIPEGLIVKACAGDTQVYSLASFIAPREELLNGTELASFTEEEVTGRTEITGNIAQRFSTYRKQGVMSGQPFEGRGTKILQFVRMPQGWRISALAWYDEP